MVSAGADVPGDGQDDLGRTGDEAVDVVLDRLEGLPRHATPAEHAAVLSDVHDLLRQRLDAADR